jgi:hypothetical protein
MSPNDSGSLAGRTRYYEDFTRFKAAILECLEGVEGKHKAAIASLLTLNFQTFEQPQILAA